MKKILLTIGRLLRDAVDPVCQDQGTVIMGTHRGYLVRMRPVVKNGRVCEWTPDIEESKQIDAVLAERAASSNQASEAQAQGGGSAQPMTQPPWTPQQPEFNPAGVAGL